MRRDATDGVCNWGWVAVTRDDHPIRDHHEFESVGANGECLCPICGDELSDPYSRPQVVVPDGDTTATTYDSFLHADPTDMPYYCVDCWAMLTHPLEQEAGIDLKEQF